jgi:hypothetical protein
LTHGWTCVFAGSVPDALLMASKFSLSRLIDMNPLPTATGLLAQPAPHRKK